MEKNQFTDKNLASLAAIMLLAPAVAFMLKEKDIDIEPGEEAFVKSYIRYGYRVLMVLILALIVWGVYNLLFSHVILYWVNYALLGISITMIVVGVFSIMNNKTILHTDNIAPSGTSVYDATVLIYFLPLYNYYLWFNETLDNHNYWRVKESVLWRSLYLVLISIWPHASLIALGAFLIIARAIMIVAGMDLFSLETKNKLNRWFYHNVEEFIAYPLSLVTTSIKKIFQKKITLTQEIDSRKQTYAGLDSISHWRTIVQYLIALAAIGYRGYMTWMTSGPTVGINLALLPQILWIGKTLMTIPSGKLPRIPLIYTLLGGKKTTLLP